jgi:hypothetical protein
MGTDARRPFVIPVVYAATLWSVEQGETADDEEAQTGEEGPEVVVDEEARASERQPLLGNVS